jgi:hypothetical protein
VQEALDGVLPALHQGSDEHVMAVLMFPERIKRVITIPFVIHTFRSKAANSELLGVKPFQLIECQARDR